MEAETDNRAVFVSQEDNVSDLVSKIRPADLDLYQKLGHVFTEAAFVNRRFVIVRLTGKRNGEPLQPEWLGEVRVLGYTCDQDTGASVQVMDEASSRVLHVGYVPAKLFRFPVFISVPVFHNVKWEAREQKDGRYTRNLVFGLCFKQQSALRFHNKDNVAVLTPNDYRSAFGVAPPR